MERIPATGGRANKLKALPPSSGRALNRVPESIAVTNREGTSGRDHSHQHAQDVKHQGQRGGTREKNKKKNEERVLEFQFHCDKIPEVKHGKEEGLKEEHDIVRVKVKAKGSSAVEYADKVKFWRDMQRELEKKYFLRHPDIAVFTFQDTSKT